MEKTIYEYFKYDKNIVDLVYQSINDINLKKYFNQICDPYLNEINFKFNNINYTEFEKYIKYFNILCIKAEELVKKGYRFSQITDYLTNLDFSELIGSNKTEIKNSYYNRRNIKDTPSFFMFFDSKDEQLIKQILDIYKLAESEYYYLIIKIYGNNYNNLNKEIKLTPKEISQRFNFINFLTKKIDEIKKDELTLNEFKKRILSLKSKQENFLDYFIEEDHQIILELLKIYKSINHPYYKIVIKKYGLDYNTKTDYNLTNQEKIKLNSFVSRLNKYKNQIKDNTITINLIKQNRKSLKQSNVLLPPNNFLNNFPDTLLASKIIDIYKEKNSIYYDLLIDVYGKNLKTLNYDKYLKEKSNLNYFIKKINEYVNDIINNKKTFDNVKSNILGLYKNSIRQNDNLIDKLGFDYELTIKLLELYKNSKNYKLLMKIYDKNYNPLSGIVLTSKEKIDYYNFLSKLKHYMTLLQNNEITFSKIEENIEKFKSTNKNISSFFEYFDLKDKDIVTSILKIYAIKNNNYYHTLIKVFGNNYDCKTNCNILPADKNTISRFKDIVKKYVAQIKKNEITIDKLEERILNCKAKRNIKEEINILWSVKLKLKENLSNEEIAKKTNMDIKQVEKQILNNLYLFNDKIEDNIKEILLNENYSPFDVIRFSYLNNQLAYLTEIQQSYLYLRLQSYINPSLTDDYIAKILNTNVNNLKNYQKAIIIPRKKDVK